VGTQSHKWLWCAEHLGKRKRGADEEVDSDEEMDSDYCGWAPWDIALDEVNDCADTETAERYACDRASWRC
jgi:hypothetical protein